MELFGLIVAGILLGSLAIYVLKVLLTFYIEWTAGAYIKRMRR